MVCAFEHSQEQSHVIPTHVRMEAPAMKLPKMEYVASSVSVQNVSLETNVKQVRLKFHFFLVKYEM